MNTLVMLFLLSLAFVAALVIQQVARYRARKGLERQLQSFSIQRDEISNQLLKNPRDGGNALINRLLAFLQGTTIVERFLLRSDTEHTGASFIILIVQVSAGVGLVGGFLTGSLPVGLLAGLIAGSLIPLRLKLKIDRRNREFTEQLPEALDFVIRALRAGHGLTIAIGMVGDEMSAPIGPEFKIVFDEVSFGIPFSDAISNMADRIDSTDLNFFIVSTRIHRETGGNFTEILESISKAIRERIKFQGRVKILSAEGKYSGVLLGALPFIIGGLLNLMNPQYMSDLWFTAEGQSLVWIGVTLVILGSLWMWNIAKIRV